MMTKNLQFTVRGFGNLLLMWSAIAMIWSARPAQAAEAVPWISAMEGKPDTLSIKHQDGEWFQATLNTPITKGDDVWLEAGGRAEIFLNPDSYVRLSGSASLRFDTLEDLSFDVAQNLGQAQYKTGPDTEIFLVTPTLGITIHANTRARVDVAEDDSTEVSTERGQVELNGPAGFAMVNTGQSLYSSPNANGYNLTGAPPPDDFDRWSDKRDRELASTPPTPGPVGQYLPPPAANELSANGDWYNDPTYGWVWRPTSVPPDWAPYTVGHWGWWPGWGWTWIPYEPWGWYPYHYGNWVVGGSGWIWVPGAIATVAWSPALVFWLDGPDWIGWCPLPFGVDRVGFQREVDRNPHSVYRYVRRNNITVVNVNNFNTTNYANVRRPLPANYRTTARVAADSRHEFRGIHNHHEFESSGPKGWVPQNRRPPEHLANRVTPAWEPGRGHEHGMQMGQPKGERPERTFERALPPGRGKERTPPVRRAAEMERHGRGPGEAPPPGQTKERPEHERMGPPGREEKAGATPPGEMKGKPERPGPPGREGGSVTPPPGEVKEHREQPTPPAHAERPSPAQAGGRSERPAAPGREGGSVTPPPGEVKEHREQPTPPAHAERPSPAPAGGRSERPAPLGREQGPAAPSKEPSKGQHQQVSPPGREQGPAAPAKEPSKGQRQQVSPPGREQGPAAPPPEPSKGQHQQVSPPGREQPPSAPSGPAPGGKPSKPGKEKKPQSFLYAPPGRERWLAESPGFMDRAQRETISPRFAPPGWDRRSAESSGSLTQAGNRSASLSFSPPNRERLAVTSSAAAASPRRDAAIPGFTSRGERTSSSGAAGTNRAQLPRNEASPPAFSRPSFGSSSRSHSSAPASSRPSFNGESSFSHRGGNRGSVPGSAGHSAGPHSGDSNGTRYKGRP